MTHAAPTQTPLTVPSEGRPDQPQAEIIMKRLAERIGANRVDMWFSQARVTVKDERVVVLTDSPFVAQWITRHLREEVAIAARDVIGQDCQIDVRLEPRDESADARNGAAGASTAVQPGTGSGRHGTGPSETVTSPAHAAPFTLNGHRSQGGRNTVALWRRLEGFVIGPSNELAHAAASRLADGADLGPMSLLFLHGPCGVGKTHLLQGSCRRAAERTGRATRVRYVTGEQFTNEYIAAVRNNDLEKFRRRIRRLDLLAIDDIHFLSNKTRTQNEFLHTVDEIVMNGCRIVLASDEHPRQIRQFSPALISRFLSGMVVQIDLPDRQTRVNIIRHLSRERGLPLGEPAIEAIANRCVGSVRELEGVIAKLSAMATLTRGGSEDEASANGSGMVLVNQLFRENAWPASAPVRITQIIEATCDRLGVSRAELLGSGRHRKVVLARATIAHLAREMTTHSYPEIAGALSRRHHSTVHTAAQRLRKQLEAGETVRLDASQRPMRLLDLLDQIRQAILRRTDH